MTEECKEYFLNQKGQAAIICSQGVLFRGGEEVKIREGMIKEDVNEGIVTLPEPVSLVQKARF